VEARQLAADRFPPRPHLAGVRAVLAIASAGAPREPTPALRRRALRARDDAGDLLGESLPDGVDEPHGPVPDRELRQPIAVRGDQFQSATDQFFRNSPGQLFPRQAEQIFPFSRLMLG